jgi:hypothetical protein
MKKILMIALILTLISPLVANQKSEIEKEMKRIHDLQKSLE